MSLGAQTFLVITDDSLSESGIRAALPSTTSIRFVSLRDALDATAALIEESGPSVILVGCSSNPEWGLRSVAWLDDVAARHGFARTRRVAMPANNLALVYRRRT